MKPCTKPVRIQVSPTIARKIASAVVGNVVPSMKIIAAFVAVHVQKMKCAPSRMMDRGTVIVQPPTAYVRRHAVPADASNWHPIPRIAALAGMFAKRTKHALTDRAFARAI